MISPNTASVVIFWTSAGLGSGKAGNSASFSFVIPVIFDGLGLEKMRGRLVGRLMST